MDVSRRRHTIARRYFRFREERPRFTGPRINERIRETTVRLIGAKGEQMGIVPIEDALRAARQVNLDLVEVAATAKPPVCKLLDHGKHKFEEEKRRRESKKKETSNKLRLVRFRPNIGEHDFQVKIRKLRELIEAGEKCRVSVTFRRREMRHVDVGVRVLDRVEEEVAGLARVESRQDRLDGRDIGLTCIPLKTRQQILKEHQGGDERIAAKIARQGKKARKAALLKAAGGGDDAEAKPDAEAKADATVDADAEPKADTDAKADADAKSDAEPKADTDAKAEAPATSEAAEPAEVATPEASASAAVDEPATSEDATTANAS